MDTITRKLTIGIWCCLLAFAIPESAAQYFGRNKPGYKRFDYKVYQTPHFEIYHYFENDSVLNEIALASEEWYRIHQAVFRDTFKTRNPLIFYSNHADFQQTTAVSSSIGVGTGGVTEALKNRIVMPVSESWAKTDHVLGHELVHAFQFNLITKGDSTSLNSLRNFPLWFVEGMAEYLSIGSVDAQTAMWMRDALLHDDFPSLRDMTRSYKYFPYRYGHSFMAFVGKTWGDTVIAPLFIETAKRGYDQAFKRVLGHDEKTISSMWKAATETQFRPYLTDSVDRVTGEKKIFDKNAGNMNLSPSMSPDGKYIVFLSERNVFSLDIFLADVRTGRIIRRLNSRIHNNEVDALNFLESAGTWSPDSRQFAFVVFSQGVNKLLIMDVKRRRVIHDAEITGVPSFNNPSWSPDGKHIVLSGLVDGSNNLYLYTPASREVKQLTFDGYAALQPSWSPDSRFIVFSTDMPSSLEPGQRRSSGYNLALFDVQDGDHTRVIDLFPGAQNLNPVYTPDGKSILFISDSDGFRNLFRYDLEEGKAYRMTDLMTGISGITPLSPAISVARDTGLVAYSYYSKSGYQIYTAGLHEFSPVEVPVESVNFDAATLAPLHHVAVNLVDSILQNRDALPPADFSLFKPVPYRPRFKLDYISNVSVGVATSRFGTGMAGAVNMLFGDMVGDNQIFASLGLNGEIYDFGGQVAYLNQKQKLNWGLALSHLPYRSGFYGASRDTITYLGERVVADNLIFYYLRTFEQKASLFMYYPISQSRRVEAGASMAWYSNRLEQYNNYYYLGYRIGVTREKLPAPGGYNLQRLDAAYVIDNSLFGIASPMSGNRSRYQVDKYFGLVDFYSVLLDYRVYRHLKPVSLAFRGYHQGRYGAGAGTREISPLFVGYPWFVRGFSSQQYYSPEVLRADYLSVNQLMGSRILVSNVEVRLPLTGPKRLAIIKSGILFTELAFFFDAGVAWDSNSLPDFKLTADNNLDRIPVMSTGASLRVNLFGAMIVEPYYAIPLRQSGFETASFGVNFFPGW